MGFIIFFLVFLTVFAGMNYYIALRFYQGLSSLVTGIRFWPVLVGFFTLALFMFLGFGRSMLPLPGWLKRFFGGIGCYYMGIFIYLLLYTAFADVAMLIPRILKLSFTAHPYYKAILSGCVLLLTCVTCIYGFINARQIDRVDYQVTLTGKQDVSDLKIVLISDLHLGALGSESRLESIVEAINEQKPDLVCIAGDFFDSDYSAIREPDAAISALRRISSTYGVYACSGNHDAGKTAGQMFAFLKEANIQLLSDTYTVIDGRLVLAGRLDGTPIGGFDGRERQPLDGLSALDPAMPVIVMDHNPANITDYGQEVDLILCGHTHKGQLFPGSVITGAMYEVDHGYYQKDSGSPHVIVTSGIGYWGMPMRVGTDSELVTITIE